MNAAAKSQWRSDAEELNPLTEEESPFPWPENITCGSDPSTFEAVVIILIVAAAAFSPFIVYLITGPTT